MAAFIHTPPKQLDAHTSPLGLIAHSPAGSDVINERVRVNIYGGDREIFWPALGCCPYMQKGPDEVDGNRLGQQVVRFNITPVTCAGNRDTLMPMSSSFLARCSQPPTLHPSLDRALGKAVTVLTEGNVL